MSAYKLTANVADVSMVSATNVGDICRQMWTGGNNTEAVTFGTMPTDSSIPLLLYRPILTNDEEHILWSKRKQYIILWILPIINI